MENLDKIKDIEGILVVDKPEGWTSFDVVRKAKRLLRIKKVGHTGTLDPMATGVLPLCLGRATKIARFITEGPKIYEGIILFGTETDTYDITGQVVEQRPVSEGLSHEQIQKAANAFLGKIFQTPPPYSALKHKGVPLYKLARKGIKIQKEPREVTISKFDILWLQGNEAGFRVECSKGTYIRSLAYDLGKYIDSCACLKTLKRVKNGPFTLKEAIPIEELEKAVGEGRINDLIIPVAKALSHIPQVIIDKELARELRFGRPVPASRLNELLEEQCVELDAANPSYLRLVLKDTEIGRETGVQQLVSVIQWLASRPCQSSDRLKTLKVWQ